MSHVVFALRRNLEPHVISVVSSVPQVGRSGSSMDRPQPLSHEFLYHTRVLYTPFANLAVVKGSSLNLVVGTHLSILCCCGDVAVAEGLKYNFMYELSTRTRLSWVVA